MLLLLLLAFWCAFGPFGAQLEPLGAVFLQMFAPKKWKNWKRSGRSGSRKRGKKKREEKKKKEAQAK